MDMTQYGESNYVTTDLVKDSPTKTAVILSDAEIVKGDYGDKPEFLVEIDGKKKKYSPNKDSVNALILAYGKDTKGWLGKAVRLSVLTVNGKERIIGEASA